MTFYRWRLKFYSKKSLTEVTITTDYEPYRTVFYGDQLSSQLLISSFQVSSKNCRHQFLFNRAQKTEMRQMTTVQLQCEPYGVENSEQYTPDSGAP